MVDDGEATPNKSDGAGSQQQENRLTVVYDKTQCRRPPTSVQLFAPFRRPNPEIVLFASYLPDRVGLIRSMRENGLNTKVCCAMTTGAQSASIKTSVATPHPPQESASQPPDVVDYERTAGLEQLIGDRRANIARRQ